MATPETLPNQAPAAGFRSWFARWPYLSLTLLVLAALGPFIARPLNIDDPLFVWSAQQIVKHPADPYGFDVNWYGMPMPMWATTKNPPLTCYYLALAGSVFGWSEPALHGAMLLPAIAVILGTYRLARRFCRCPGLAAGITLFSPVFLISGTSVMCDTMMLAFWMWAVVLWVEGLEKNDRGRLAGSGVLIALAALTKYFGICLVPLLLVHALVQRRRMGAWILSLVIPVAALAAYEAATRAAYGTGLFTDAEHFARGSAQSIQPGRTVGLLVGLTFTGGCLATASLLTRFARRPKMEDILAIVVIIATVALFMTGTIFKPYAGLARTALPLTLLQMAYWAMGGMGILVLAAEYIWHERTPAAWLLGLWALGTFFFASVLNWTINGRSILPMAPAVAILAVVRWERSTPPAGFLRALWTVGLAGGVALALALTWADFRQAVVSRNVATQAEAVFGNQKGSLWFDAHWGIQHYLEVGGGKPVDWRQPAFGRNDLLVVPLNNPTLLKSPGTVVQDFGNARLETVLTNQGPAWLATMNKEVGAGFYSSVNGPLPFAFGRVPPDIAYVYRVEPSTPPAPRPSSP